MKFALLILGFSISSYASDIDYSKCSIVMDKMGEISGNFITFDESGKVKVGRTGTSMRMEGSNAIYSAYELEIETKTVKNVQIKTPKKVTDKEELIITYDNIEDGKDNEIIKSISYTLKDKNHRSGGAYKVDFKITNNTCVPEIKKIDLLSGNGKIVRFFANKLFGKLTHAVVGAKDIYKCRALHEELKLVEDLKTCSDAASRLKKLNDITSSVVLKSDKDIEKSIKNSDIKEFQKKLTNAFSAIVVAQTALDVCNEFGYKDILDDDEYWKKIKTAEVDNTTQIENKSVAK